MKYASSASEQEDESLRAPPSPAHMPLEISASSISQQTRPVLTLSPHSSHNSALPLSLDTAILSLKRFASFLLSADNAVFADQHGKIVQDMTRPLPEYFISSSHNTYLVGNQLVGESTIEGYIRALLHGCRSVESQLTILDLLMRHTEPFPFS